jgi:aspartate beta-hydroxylase
LINNPQQLNAHGMEALAQHDYFAAVNCFAAAAALDPREATLWLNLATAQRLAKDDLGERKSLEQALDIDRTLFMAWLRKAELCERLGQRKDALLSWDAVLQLSSGVDQSSLQLADALEHGRQFVAEHYKTLDQRLSVGLANILDDLPLSKRRRFDACIDRVVGRRKQFYTHDCAGVHVPFLPADEFFDREHFPWLPRLEAQADRIREEVLALLAGGAEGIRPYVQMEKGVPDTKWQALDGALDWSAFFLWEYGVRNEEACRRCPQTAAALDEVPRSILPGRAPSAFFSILKPHTRIPAHTGVTNSRAIIHLPLIVPYGCGFRVGGETRHWREGEAFAFDDTIEHEAWNDSDEPRVILIFDVWNPHLSTEEQKLLHRFYEVSDEICL